MKVMDFVIAAQQSRTEPSDYEKDGFIYCGKCDTPKQCEVVLFGKRRIVPCLCKCQNEQFEKDEKDKKELKKKMRINEIRDEAFQDGRMKSWTFKNDDQKNLELSKRMRNYAKNFNEFQKNGRGLLLYGNTGNGKTFMGCCIVNFLIDAGFTALVKNFNSISNELFSEQRKDEYMERLNRVSILMLDDLDIERESAYMNEVVYSVIDGRYRAKKPIIVTTNLSAAQMKNATTIEKQRIYSRLMDMCIPISVTGEDRRYENAKKQFEKDMKILNGG